MVESRTNGRVVTRVVFKTIAVAAVMGGTIVAPNAASLLDKYFRYNDKQRARARQVLNELKYTKLLSVKKIDGQLHYRLTDKGLARYHKLTLSELIIPTPNHWDKKWRAVIFDIPESHRKYRDKFTMHLRSLGFYMLQRSIWIHPFDCKEQVGILSTAFGLEKDISFIVIVDGNFTEHATQHFKQTKVLL